VKRSGFWGRDSRLSVPLVLIALLCGSGSNSASFAQRPLATSSTNTAPELSSEGQAWLRAAISGGNLPDLRGPDFSDYSKHLKKFYEFNQESLRWIKALEPIMQVQQVIALLLKAHQRGLSAEDYDGPRWNDRLARLKPATRPREERAPILQEYVRTASSGRRHFPLPVSAPLADFAAIAECYPVYRINAA
jgi:hypothetical protein